MNRQLALAIQLNDDATFADFCWADNALLKTQIDSILNQDSPDRLLYFWGTKGSGKSHLLQACCQAMTTKQSAIYLPLSILKDCGPEVMEGMDEQDLICLDDIDAIAENTAWEEALFHLYNRVRDNGHTRLLITGSQPPKALAIKLPDLRSRLSWGLVIELNELNDDEKINSLKIRAEKRGFELTDAVGQFLLRRCARNMHALYELFDQLDEASFVAQRKITVPFVKMVLGL